MGLNKIDEQLLDSVIHKVNEMGKMAEKLRSTNMMTIKGLSDLERIPHTGGCYWIATTMPVDNFDPIKFKGKIRVKPPKGTQIIVQEGTNSFVIYNGTEGDIHRRISQHLFNKGHEKTGKLGLEINITPYQEYEWSVFWLEIENVPLRNAIEIWWRYNVGWPIFCKR